MGLIIVDAGKCNRDEFCVRDCPTAIISLPDKGCPEIAPDKESSCLECGHCVAVCPFGALSHVRIPIEKSAAIQDKLRVSEEQAAQFLRSRRSVRRFLDKSVEREKVRRLIETARYAPTGGNSQMVEWLVLDDKSRIREIAGLTVNWLREIVKNPAVVAASPYLSLTVAAWDAGIDSVLRGAPVLITAMAPKEAMNGLVDLTLALSYLDLFATPMHLGTCWAGLLQGALLNSPAVKAAVGVPATHPHHYPIMVGYPEPRYFRLPERRAPKIYFGDSHHNLEIPIDHKST
ncbi:MAG: nitroreductase [Acidobacteria bacterium]|nr:nitroreductase [Acidobacteriota bacterium]